MESLVFLNGEIVPAKDAQISPFDYGYLYGYGLFETMRAYNGKVFRIKRHLNRLYDAARNIDIDLDKYNLEKNINDTIEANKLSDARIRLTVSKGKGDITPDPSSCKMPTVFITAQKYSPLPVMLYVDGCNVMVSRYKRSSVCPISMIKSANYLINILAKTEAKASGAYDTLLLNEKGFVSETSMSNIFMVYENTLLTPPVESGILPGITRETVMEISADFGLKVDEKDITLDLLEKANEIFLTNSLIEILPVQKINDKAVFSVKKATVTNMISDGYKKLVFRELKLS